MEYNRESVEPFLGKTIILKYECKKTVEINNEIREISYPNEIYGMINSSSRKQINFILNDGDSISFQYSQITSIMLVSRYYQTT